MLPTLIAIASWATIPFSGLVCWKDAWWYYITSTQTAYYCQIENEEFYKQHEIGHYIWFTLTDKQRGEYIQAYKKDLKKWSKYFYRDYSMVLVEEDFADNYALLVEWKRHPIMLQQRINLVHKFLN